jgi:RNA polymerase sigma-70 factor (ECF subfamily)
LLFARAKTGEEAAFGEIYNLFFKKIYRFIFFRVGHKEVAEDLAEEVFLKAFTKIASINESSAFEGWLYQIARNLVIDYYRQKKSTVALEEIENTLEYETNVVDVVNLQKQQKIFLKLLKELGAEQQVVIKLKFFEELENSEIAELLGKNEGAIRVIQHRAIIKLQELIKKSGQE